MVSNGGSMGRVQQMADRRVLDPGFGVYNGAYSTWRGPVYNDETKSHHLVQYHGGKTGYFVNRSHFEAYWDVDVLYTEGVLYPLEWVNVPTHEFYSFKNQVNSFGRGQNGGSGSTINDPLFSFSNSTERGVNLTSTIIGGSVSAGASDAARSGRYLTRVVNGTKVGGSILGGVGFGVTAYNVGAKYVNGKDNTADYVDLAFSGGFLAAGFLVSNPIGWGVLIGAGVSYGIYRIAAGDVADAWINEKIGFRD
jgi:hypothetical protein